jgi:cation-transporting ATPase E
VVAAALGALADDENANATLRAVGAAFPPPVGWVRSGAVPFSSARKWSAATFAGVGSWIIGAPEMVCPDPDDPARRRADTIAATGCRVLLLAHAEAAPADESLPVGVTPRALVLLEERVRPDARDTLRYFADQGVALKVISGDNPRTVGAVAARVGLPGADDPVDARELPDDPEALAEVVEHRTVFGRVTPQQKRAMVTALQSRGHVVAMTGDGVNDALALKDADIGVAMGSGAAATRAVAQLVLLDGRFATMPGVVAEGRRVIANIERSANLFVTKTVYAILIAVVVAALGWKYPYLPRQLTIVSTFTIGIPGFFLALAPNTRRYVPGFLERVMAFTFPAGAIAAVLSLSAFGVAYYVEDLPLRTARTCATVALVAVGLWVLVCLARPFNWWRALLVAAMAGSVGVILAVPGLRDFYALRIPDAAVLVELVVIGVVAVVAIEIAWRASRRVIARRNPAYAEAAAHID